ncbi:hypothetical protein [Micromonospora avicenniae]|uniref:hypothetical protein n=1 Tax=Micromonospora avicenniae TaxID=1198245 RepID=UPI003421277E
MSSQELTLESVKVRCVCVPLKRPVVSKVGVYREWLLILIDLRAVEGLGNGASLRTAT